MTDAEAKTEAIEFLEEIALMLSGHGVEPESHHRCNWCRLVMRVEDFIRRAK